MSVLLSREVPLQNRHLPPAWLTPLLTPALAPFPSSDKPCELYCSPLGKDSPLLVADRVLDGTPCGPYETDLCVHGRCQVTRFPCVLGGALARRLPFTRGARSWAGASGDLRDGSYLRRCRGAASCKLADPPAVTKCDAHLQAHQELELGYLNESQQHHNLKNV